MNARSVAFIRSLAARFPGLAALLREHLADFGEMLPHIFFGDLTRYSVTLHLRATREVDAASARELREILDLLERTYASGGQELRELIGASFLENLPNPAEDGHEIRSLLGPEMSRQFDMVWPPGSRPDVA